MGAKVLLAFWACPSSQTGKCWLLKFQLSGPSEDEGCLENTGKTPGGEDEKRQSCNLMCIESPCVPKGSCIDFGGA